MLPELQATSNFIGLDLDGTLIDARRRQVTVAKQVIGLFGLAPLDGDAFWRLKREGLDTVSALERLAYPAAAAREVAKGWMREIETPCWLELDAWLPGALEGLAMLKEAGFPVRVLTARSQPEAALAQASTLGLASWVQAFEVVNPRYAAEAKALKLAGAVGFVGDTEIDARAACLASVPFVGVTTGQRSRQFLKGQGVAPLVDDFVSAVSSILSRVTGSDGGRSCIDKAQ